MMGTNGRSKGGRHGCARICARIVPALCLLAAVGFCLAPAAMASSPSFTWTGGSEASGAWSEAENWKGDSAPTAAEKIEALTFPRLTSTACTAEPAEAECYTSNNDLTGLTAKSMQIDDGDEYTIGGGELTLGAGGLNASPSSGSKGAAEDYMELPLQLGAAQKWTVTGRAGSPAGENGVLLEGAVTGPSDALTVELSDGGGLYLENETEAGPLMIDGENAAKAGFENGVVALDGELNSEDEQSVKLSHILFSGSGEVGPLTTDGAELDIGNESKAAGGIEAASVKLDSGSKVTFQITGTSMVAWEDYSQLLAKEEGAIELGGANIGINVGPPSQGKACPILAAGQTYTFVSTTGTLSGSFGNASESGAEIPITFAKSCGSISQKMQITYHESGGTQTVTGTIPMAPEVTKEPSNVSVVEGGEATFEASVSGVPAPTVQWELSTTKGVSWGAVAGATSDTLTVSDAKTSESGDEYRAVFTNAAGKAETTDATLTVNESEQRHEQEVLAAAAKKRQEEEAARGAVLGAKEGSPDAVIASTSLQASGSGVVSVKISCPTGVSSCEGTVTLRTLNAVIAGVAGAAKVKAAVLTLATGSFAVPGGEVRTVTLHLSAKARTLLGRSHALHVRVTIVAHNPAGGTHTGYVVATLHAPKAAHNKA